MLDKVKKYITDNGMIQKGDRIVVGVSGGADSTALLEVLCSLRDDSGLSLFVVHINHGIRAEASEDADFVRGLCKERDIPFYLFEENIPQLAKKYHMSEEEAGRKFRYQCFTKVMRENNADKLAVAHHMDDQAETVIFHMVRGTDLSGMSGMRPISALAPFTDCVMDDAYIIRPLLNVRRAEIVEYLEKKGMIWKEDITNGDDAYSRNRIRNNVMTELNKINESATEHVAEFAALASEYDDYVRKQALAFISRETAGDNSHWQKNGSIRVNRQALLGEDKIISYRAIYEMLVNVCGAKKDITREHIASVYELIKKQSGKELFLPYGTKAEVSYEYLILCKAVKIEPAQSKEYVIAIEELVPDNMHKLDISSNEKVVFTIISYDADNAVDNNFQKNYTKYFDCDTIGDTLHIRYPQKEDYLVYDGEGHRKSLLKFMKDIKVPKNERMCLPVLASGHEILWVIGKRRCENHQLNPNTRRVLKVDYIL